MFLCKKLFFCCCKRYTISFTRLWFDFVWYSVFIVAFFNINVFFLYYKGPLARNRTIIKGKGLEVIEKTKILYYHCLEAIIWKIGRTKVNVKLNCAFLFKYSKNLNIFSKNLTTKKSIYGKKLDLEKLHEKIKRKFLGVAFLVCAVCVRLLVVMLSK